jgi:hypothetical protein
MPSTIYDVKVRYLWKSPKFEGQKSCEALKYSGRIFQGIEKNRKGGFLNWKPPGFMPSFMLFGLIEPSDVIKRRYGFGIPSAQADSQPRPEYGANADIDEAAIALSR